MLDLRTIRKLDLDEQLGTELWVSYVLGQLPARNRCPHFLRLYKCFRSGSALPDEGWGGEAEGVSEAEGEPLFGIVGKKGTKVSGKKLSAAPYQYSEHVARSRCRTTASHQRYSASLHRYVTAEFAEGGDMEEHMKRQPKMMYPTIDLPTILYQMLFALHAAQRELSLRHYDIKLLNFFLKQPALPAGKPCLSVTYGVHGKCHSFSIDATQPSLCMLADFGTADIATESYGAVRLRLPLKEQITLCRMPSRFLVLVSACACT